MDEKHLKELIEGYLAEKGVNTYPITNDMRQDTWLKQGLYYDLNRRIAHRPDLMVDNLPCEIKSPNELYIQCRYSRAHLISFLLQIIHGHCLSYADLFRPPNAKRLRIYLMVPKFAKKLGDLEVIFHDILASMPSIYREYMGIYGLKFSPPEWSTPANSIYYGFICNPFKVMVTHIDYDIRRTNEMART